MSLSALGLKYGVVFRGFLSRRCRPQPPLGASQRAGHDKFRHGSLRGRGWLGRIAVGTTPLNRHRGIVDIGGSLLPCALGRAGVVGRKREGDGATPAGTMALLAVLYRSDRLSRPRTALPVIPLRPDSGWCDDPLDRHYNRAVRVPVNVGHERLWRADHVYDIVAILDYNLSPVVRGAGSAIFLHLARPEMSATEGCVAVSLPSMRRLLARSRPGTFLDIRRSPYRA